MTNSNVVSNVQGAVSATAAGLARGKTSGLEVTDAAASRRLFYRIGTVVRRLRIPLVLLAIAIVAGGVIQTRRKFTISTEVPHFFAAYKSNLGDMPELVEMFTDSTYWPSGRTIEFTAPTCDGCDFDERKMEFTGCAKGGEQCKMQACVLAENPCSGNGLCNPAAGCSCATGWRGVDCALTADSLTAEEQPLDVGGEGLNCRTLADCCGKGVCISGSCVCEEVRGFASFFSAQLIRRSV